LARKGKVTSVATASVKSAELTGKVIVGPESAARLSKELGRPVAVGEEFDLGTLAYYHENFFKRLIGRRKIKRNVFNP
jgi:hypothetical protein